MEEGEAAGHVGRHAGEPLVAHLIHLLPVPDRHEVTACQQIPENTQFRQWQINTESGRELWFDGIYVFRSPYSIHSITV